MGIATSVHRKSLKFTIMTSMTTCKSIEDLVDHSMKAEKYGFDGIWLADHLNSWVSGEVPEVWPLLAVIGTKTKKIEIGPCVSDMVRRHPVMLAQSAATLDRLTNGRLVLGLGAGEAMNIDIIGLDRSRPVARLREGIEIIRRMWNSSKDEPVTFAGQFYNLNRAFLQVKPIERTLPIYIGAIGQNMLRLCGEVSDGWLPSSPESPETYKKIVSGILEAANGAHRDGGSLEFGARLFTSLSDDENLSLGLVERAVRFRLGMHKLSIADIMLNESTLEQIEEAGSEFRLSDIEQMVAIGNADKCIDVIDRLRASGATNIMIHNMGPDAEKVYETYAMKVIPYFEIER